MRCVVAALPTSKKNQKKKIFFFKIFESKRFSITFEQLFQYTARQKFTNAAAADVNVLWQFGKYLCIYIYTVIYYVCVRPRLREQSMSYAERVRNRTAVNVALLGNVHQWAVRLANALPVR